MKKEQRLKILHLRSSGGFYGAEGVILGLLEALKSKDMVNRVLCINNFKNPHVELIDRARLKGLDAVSIDCKGLFDFVAIRKIRKMLKEECFSIIHTHDYKASAFGLLASLGLKVNRVSTNHLWTHGNIKLRGYEFIEGILFNFFDRIIAVSDPVADEVRPFLFNKGKLSVISNGIDVDGFSHLGGKEEKARSRMKFSLEQSNIVLGIVGRLAQQKGHEYLFRAVSNILQTNKNFPLKVLVAGDGALDKDLKELVNELGISKNIIFTGFCDDIKSVLGAIDVLVMPSLSEGLPMVLLEAMSAGVLVIATPVGDIPKLIKDGFTGILVNPKDVAGLAAAIMTVIKNRNNDAESALKMVRNAKDLVKKEYSVESMTQKYIEIYTLIFNPRIVS
ncbi:MAG: glycosyltransferase [Candidatus Omnitrophica bacterium]|nr:glycosyltransferase [Candidatus Omnitrophota bacterium]